ncbi:Thermoresistant gluconokinase [compost metagenome]
MRKGVSLTDEDRLPWLREVGIKLRTAETPLIVGCSALRYAYRLAIAEEAGFPITFVYLSGARDIIATRMASRTGHFMPTQLLDSQFKALEEPLPHERAVRIDIDQPLNAIVAQAAAFLRSID